MSLEDILNPTPEEILTAERDVALASVSHWQQIATDLERRCADAHREYSTLKAQAAAELAATVDGIAQKLETTLRLILDTDEHVVEVRDTDFGLMHPLKCRPDLLGCATNVALNALAGPPAEPGRYSVSLDGKGKVVIGAPVAADYDPVRLTDLLAVAVRPGVPA